MNRWTVVLAGLLVPASAGTMLAADVEAREATASPAGHVRIISADELSKHLDTVRVLDARGRKAFHQGHVPGSWNIQWEDWTLVKPNLVNLLFGDPAGWGKVPKASQKLQERLRALGLSNETRIVVVGQPSGWGEEGRIAWNLLYWGAENVALLDGGYPAWASAGHAIEGKTALPPAGGRFILHLEPERRADLQKVLDARESRERPLVDVRSSEEYAGRRLRGQRRGGHIPGSVLVPLARLYREDGRYVDGDTLKRLAPYEGTSPIAYCVGGVRSALFAVLYEARLGIVAANYDGSIWEWSTHEELPLEKSAPAERSLH